MRRALAVLLGSAVLAAGCSSGDDQDAGRTTTTPSGSSSSTPTTTEAACTGLGAVPEGGEVTWVSGGKLFGSTGCLVQVVGATAVSGWGGNGDRVVVDNHVLGVEATPIDPFPDGPLVLSRPTGKSVLRVTSDGKLFKRELPGGPPREIGFMAEHEQAVYHPAGRHIVSSGRNDDGGAELMIADNLGGNPQRLLLVEEAKSVHSPTFTASGALLYTADHGTHWDLHRLVLGEETFSTVATVKAPGVIADVTASPFSGGGVAWTEGRCTGGERPKLRASQDGKFLTVPSEVERARPVAWLPDRSLVVLDRGGCEADSAGALFVVRAGGATRLADNVTSAAVRAVLPPPPAPPKSIPQQAPA